MNLKERGITVGAILIILILIITSSTLIKTYNKDKKTTFDHSHEEEVSSNQTFYQNSFNLYKL